MGQKNPDLCERAWCRNRWTCRVHGFHHGRGWTLRVCEDHAEIYRGVNRDCANRWVTVTKRSDEAPKT